MYSCPLLTARRGSTRVLFARECATTVRIPKTLKSLFLLERRTKRRLPLFLAIVATRLHDGLIILVRDRSFPSPPSIMGMVSTRGGGGYISRRRYVERVSLAKKPDRCEDTWLEGYLVRGGSGPRDLRGQKRWVGKRNRGVIRVRDRCTAQRATMFRG